MFGLFVGLFVGLVVAGCAVFGLVVVGLAVTGLAVVGCAVVGLFVGETVVGVVVGDFVGEAVVGPIVGARVFGWLVGWSVVGLIVGFVVGLAEVGLLVGEFVISVTIKYRSACSEDPSGVVRLAIIVVPQSCENPTTSTVYVLPSTVNGVSAYVLGKVSMSLTLPVLSTSNVILVCPVWYVPSI